MGLTDKNLFAYCDNNPVIRADHGGDFWNVVIGAVVGAVAGDKEAIIATLASLKEEIRSRAATGIRWE